MAFKGGRACAVMSATICSAVISAPSCAESLDDLYQRAKAEGALVFYSGGPVEPYERFAKDFKEKYPGIQVSITGGFSNVLNDRINAQLRDKKLEVDMAFFQTVQDFIAWKQQGRLLNFKPDGYDKIAPVFRDDDGAFTTTLVNTISYAYNSNLVAAADAPRSALDFLKPQFQGKLITVYPADDDATLYLFHTIVQKYGWAYMDKYMAQKPTFMQGHLGVARRVASGEFAATFDATSTAWRLKRDGQPIEAIFSSEDDTPVFTVTAGIFKDAPHPDAARLFLAWYLSPEQQRRTGVFSARTDVPPPLGLQPLFSYKLANGYKEFVSDEKTLQELRKRYESYTGPVVNVGGVR
jgi:ABC-type Fe3+ transport system substrate-binding protein